MTQAIATILVSCALCTAPCCPLPMMTLEQFVRGEAIARGVDPDRAWATVMLESSGDPLARGDDGMAWGLWQFRGADSSNTWAWLCGVTGHAEWDDDANRDDWYRSTIVALDAIALGYGDHWAGYRLAGDLLDTLP